MRNAIMGAFVPAALAAGLLVSTAAGAAETLQRFDSDVECATHPNCYVLGDSFVDMKRAVAEAEDPAMGIALNCYHLESLRPTEAAADGEIEMQNDSVHCITQAPMSSDVK